MHFSPSFINAVGMVAAFSTTVALVPQLARIWRLKSAREISLNMFVLFSFGVSLWLFYGIEIHSPPVIVANAVTLVFSLAILVLKLRFDRRPGKASALAGSSQLREPGRK
jgi:MtN3 and saliva related transmembrane protein